MSFVVSASEQLHLDCGEEEVVEEKEGEEEKEEEVEECF